MEFEPLSLLAALVVAVALLVSILWVTTRKKWKASVILPTLPVLARGPRGVRVRLHFLPEILRLIALLLLLLAFARPRHGDEKVHVSSEGVAIMMLVDRSSSMKNSMMYGGEELTRLEVVKKAFTAFVLGGDGLPGRINDLVGLSSFARFVEHNCPLTLDHEGLGFFLENIKTAERVEDGTSIGDALQHATLTLLTGTEETKVKSRFIVLLSDGEQTAGNLTPVEGAKLAASQDIKVHCIFVGGPVGRSRAKDIFSIFVDPEPTGEELEEVARITGGSFSKASDGAALLEVTRRLDKAEKTEIRERVIRFKEQFELPLLLALAVLVLELTLRATWLLRIP